MKKRKPIEPDADDMHPQDAARSAMLSAMRHRIWRYRDPGFIDRPGVAGGHLARTADNRGLTIQGATGNPEAHRPNLPPDGSLHTKSY